MIKVAINGSEKQSFWNLDVLGKFEVEK